jgi:Methyltransferase domain
LRTRTIARMRLPGRARRLATSALRRGATRAGFDVVPTGEYSPVPEIPPPSDPTWHREYLVDVDLDRQIEFVEGELARYLTELPDAFNAIQRRGFQLWNGQYQAGDAELLYALVRYLRPTRMLELGSGYSTLASAAACAANKRDGAATQLVAVDPAPRTPLPADLEGLSHIERRDCRELPLSRFCELEAGDILFIDTSHVVKLGSEVTWLVLEVLPRLTPGVWVHFHDVFLPYEYPRYLFELEAYFNEQYIVGAFLAGNDGWEVMLALCALYRRRRDRLADLVPSLRATPADPRWHDVTPAAFWLRRTEPPLA